MRLDGLNNEMQAMMFEAMNTQPASTGQKVGALWCHVDQSDQQRQWPAKDLK